MNIERRIRKEFGSLHAIGKRRLIAHSGSMPRDVLDDAAKRLAIASLVMSALLVFYIFIYTVLPLLGGPRIGEPFGTLDLINFFMLALTVGVFLLARSGRLRPQRMLDVGLGLEIALAFVVGVAIKLTPGPLHIPAGWGISEICVLILIFPVIVPNAPWKTLLVGLFAASMDPLGVWLAVKSGKAIPPDTSLFVAYFSNYVCALLSMMPSFILNHLGKQVTEARELGSYQLTELIGRGGMGEVWRAEHLMLARQVAIKLIRPDLLTGKEQGDPESLLGRFQLEAQATAALRSPHTIQVYDFGVTQEGSFYYVMELLDGWDLKRLVERFGPQEPARCVHFLLQICHSLGEAHENGLIHRDIKPANVFACRCGREVDFAKVLDFGLVKSQGTPRDDARMTAAGSIPGSPDFMAPEQLMGDRPVDARSDIYAIGGLAFWLLTGQVVFPGETVAQVIVDQVKTPAPAPSTRTELKIPELLDTVILSCLAKDPADRPASVDELAARLTACSRMHCWTEEMAHAWWDRHLPR